MKKLFQNPIWLLLFFVTACKQEYYPEITSTDQSVLVVEGMLNIGGQTDIKLSRTYKLDDTARMKPETGAQLFVESESGSLTSLEEYGDPGTYHSWLTLNPTEKYRLRIATANQNRYESDFVPVLKNPAIDSVNWKRDDKGVQVFVNTHNPENDTRYYRWEYDETWEINSAYFATWKLVDGTPQRMYPPEQVYYCWLHFKSSNILLGSTAQLASDVIFEKPLVFIPKATNRLSVRYSVLVRQYPLDKQGYSFYQLLKKNTESLGSIFDAQPSELTGNIHGITKPEEPVIGYITAGLVQDKRIFISSREVPDWGFKMGCDTVQVPNDPDIYRGYFNGDYLPYSANEPFVTMFYAAPNVCVDCRSRGGVTERPDFW
jgi:hypothetical protein